MSFRSLLFILLFFILSHNSFSQAIYKGGSGDGFSDGNYVQSSNVLLDLYKGGNEDGFATIGIIQADNISFNVYNGGIADGFATVGIVQADNVSYNVYNGGNADGFATAGIIQADNISYNIYNGGIADGFVILGIIQADNISYNIYNGGIADGFSKGTVGSLGNEVPLPIELLSFTGGCDNGNLVFNWTTASEINNDYFSVERSPDAKQWQVIGIVKGEGNLYSEHNYSYKVTEPYIGISYCRLKQTDFNGQYKYSQVINVENCRDGESDNLTLYPNPSMGTINLLFNGDNTQVNSIEIYNVNGERVYYSKKFQSEISLPDKKSGLYFIHVILPTKIINEKLLIER